jgi:membrane-associated phospholipid phosphatase
MVDFLFQVDWVPPARSHVLTIFFRTVTDLGSNWFTLLFLPLGYFFWRKDTFTRLIVICAFSEILNVHLKAAYMAPRPDPFFHMVTVSGWSFPSGHAQHATVMWLWLAREMGPSKAWIAGAFIALPVALSRVYLGVHYGCDIIAGALAGLTMIAYFRWMFRYRRPSLVRSHIPVQLAALIAFQLIWAAIAPSSGRNFTFLPAIIYMGFLTGVTLGQSPSVFQKSHLRWGIPVTIIVFGIGLFTELGVSTTWIGPLGLGTHPVSVYLQFALLGMWMGFIAPIVFKKLEMSD